MPPAVERMHRTSWRRWDLDFSLPTTFRSREQESKHWHKWSKQDSVDPWSKKQLKFGGWEGLFPSRAAHRACGVCWAGVVVRGGWERKGQDGERGSVPERSLGNAEQCAVFEGLGKREVNIRTIKLDAYYEQPATSALQRAVMVIFPVCFLIYCTRSRKAMPKV